MFNRDTKFKFNIGTDVASGDADKRVLSKIIGRGEVEGRENVYLVETTRLDNKLRELWVDESKIQLPQPEAEAKE